ncbi:MAG: hypothetical protein ACJ790_02525, partial [Myxococcaceae bacterium]
VLKLRIRDVIGGGADQLESNVRQWSRIELNQLRLNRRGVPSPNFRGVVAEFVRPNSTGTG